jgi:hypothetical protein
MSVLLGGGAMLYVASVLTAACELVCREVMDMGAEVKPMLRTHAVCFVYNGCRCCIACMLAEGWDRVCWEWERAVSRYCLIGVLLGARGLATL